MNLSQGRPLTPDQAPSFQEVLRTLNSLEATFSYVEDVLEMLEVIYTSGTEAHREHVPRRPELFDQLRDRLAKDDRTLLNQYEEYTHDVMRAWGEDRFRTGFALGAGVAHFFQHPRRAHGGTTAHHDRSGEGDNGTTAP